MSAHLIEHYYRCFNERRFDEAAALFTEDAVVELIHGARERGGAAYWRFAGAWVAAFRNATFTIERIQARAGTLHEVYLLATGTHSGILDLGMYRFKPSGAEARLHVRELLDIRNEQIAASVLTVDLNDLVDQLTMVDYADLDRRLRKISALRETLAHTPNEDRREVAARLGAELDAARRAIRPYYFK